MRIYVTGHEGNIGRSLLERGCFPFVSDITDHKQVADTVLSERPDLIIHCAALTDVNFCEDKANADKVIDVNLKATVNLLECAPEIPVLVISSDHVFDGKRGNYREEDVPKPVNFYGLSKMTAEAACKSFNNAYVVRTSALFTKGNKDFGKFEESLKVGHSVEVPTVLYRTFLHVDHFVTGILDYASKIQTRNIPPALIHISGTENISWYELALGIADLGKYDAKLVHPRKHKDDSFVPRPLNGGLNTARARKIGIPLYSFYDGLRLIYG